MSVISKKINLKQHYNLNDYLSMLCKTQPRNVVQTFVESRLPELDIGFLSKQIFLMGDFGMVQWLENLLHGQIPYTTESFSAICQGECIETVKWWLTKYPSENIHCMLLYNFNKKDINETFVKWFDSINSNLYLSLHLVATAELEVVKIWVQDKYNAIQRNMNTLFIIICMQDNLPLLRWWIEYFELKEEFCVGNELYFRTICQIGSKSVIQWWLRHFPKTESFIAKNLDAIFITIFASNNIETLVWWYARYPKTRLRIRELQAISELSNSAKLIEWLSHHFSDPNNIL